MEKNPIAGPDIETLTKRLATGEETAFREFHARYFDRLHQFLIVVARGNEAEAREALQQTLLRVAKYVRPFSTEEVFWSWLKVLARSAARDIGRGQQRYWNLLGRFERHGFEKVDDGDEEAELARMLDESLEEMDSEGRTLLKQRYFDQRKIKDLASERQTTAKAVESRLARLRDELKERILRKLQ